MPNLVRASVELPPWLAAIASRQIQLPAEDDARMQWAIEIAQRNVDEGTGGPFAAAVVDESTGECIAVGVNLVISSGMSISHAEAIAIMLAQLSTGSFDLASVPSKKFTLFATGQPCIQCFGILWWSGVRKLVCAARGEDVETITGFREGPLPAIWPQLLAERPELPMQVVRDVRRQAACDVLRSYKAAGRPVYNPGSTAGD